MRDILIRTILHKHHRYPTVGDYWVDEFDNQQVRVSNMQNDDFEFLVVLHELIENHLTQRIGIKEEDITDFDMAHLDAEEPGHLKDAPYHREHIFAECIERIVAHYMLVDWEEYTEAIEKLG